MSFQFQDLAEIADLSRVAETRSGVQATGLESRLAMLVDELQDVIKVSRGHFNPQDETIRSMRVEFGFDPDDLPTAHLRPLCLDAVA